MPGTGTFFCLGCGSSFSLQEEDHLPECPRCGASRFRRDSIFSSRQEHGDSTAEMPLPTREASSAWLRDARAHLPGHGRFLVSVDTDDGEVAIFPLEVGWTRIGRSINAGIRLDDPSVSRRHALIVSEPQERVRILDDRSLNGVFLNGDRVESAPVADGDEVTIGRFHLIALER